MKSRLVLPAILTTAALASSLPAAVPPASKLAVETVPTITFTPTHNETRIPTSNTKLASDLPADWSDYNFLIIEWRANSSERFHLEIFANDGPNNSEVMVAKRISPFQGAWVRAAIPLEFFRKPAREGFDLAATYNKHRDSYWININFGGWAPCKNVTALGFQMDGPIPVAAGHSSGADAECHSLNIGT